MGGVMDRRHMMLGLGATGLAAACATVTDGGGEAGVIYAPAPPATPLHALNQQLGEALRKDGVTGWRVEPLALPESVNRAAALLASERRRTLPIMTTADFALARNGAGPHWHGYDRASRDLLFVSTLYDVGFGFQVVDPAIRKPSDLAGQAIAVPARPSAVRMMSEALIAAGWGVEDVRFVDCSPPEAARLLAAGEVVASAWNLVLPGAQGMAPMLPSPDGARYLAVTAEAVEAMNAAYGFHLGPYEHPEHGTLISFAQALAAWSDTPEDMLTAMLEAVARHGSDFPGLPGSREAMLDWPGLQQSEIHPAARKFHAQIQL